MEEEAMSLIPANVRSRYPLFTACLILVASVTGSLISDSAHAAASTEALDFAIHQPYAHTRALGMGNAFTAVADDHAAMFYNPAGLARLDEWNMNFQLRAMLDAEVLQLQQDIEKISKSSTSTTGTGNDVTEMVQLLESHYGDHYSLRLPTTGWFWVWPRWGLAVVPLDLNVEMEIHQTVGPAASVVGTQDSVIALSYARSPKWFSKHKVSLGMTLKGIYRGYFNRSLTAVELALDSDVLRPEYANEGFTVDGDIGMLFSPDTSGGFWSWARYTRPTFGFTVRNVADYGFPSNFHLIHKDSKEPPRLQRRFDFGTMWELPDWWVFKSRFAFDIRDVGHNQFTMRKGTHAGVEFLWKMFGWWKGGWRAGINQGYWTAGFTGKFGIFQLDIASYGEEVGSSETKKESRRYMVQTSLDF
jgi:hypothetical protein